MSCHSKEPHEAVQNIADNLQVVLNEGQPSRTTAKADADEALLADLSPPLSSKAGQGLLSEMQEMTVSEDNVATLARELHQVQSACIPMSDFHFLKMH